ncbi:MAG: hypothetical protein MUE49_12360 [Rhodospirillales bacterium]|jgi:hypothetical protein|nr:hypothetical protein [Rhodospirillales bacterium]
MMIWRNLDPKLLGELLVAAAEALAAKRNRPPDPQPPHPPFRFALAMAAEPHRVARNTRA